MNIYLTKLLIAFFQRTTYMDISQVENYIINNIQDFKNHKKNKFPILPDINFSGSPISQIISTTSPFIITIYNNRIDFVINGIFFKKKYSDCLGSFLAISKLLSRLVASNENICGRIGIVNESFVSTETPQMLIRKRFIKENSLVDATNILINYTDIINFKHIDVNQVNIIQAGTLNTTPKQKGIILQRDINIKKMQVSISSHEIEAFIDFAGNKITKDSMLGVVHE